MDLVHELSLVWAVAKRKHTVNVHEAKTHLSRLLDRVAAGDEVTIAKAGKPIARLVPIAAPDTRRLGLDAGRVTIADDFDTPLPDDVLAEFER
jgi:prevent-host-death family protein